MIQLEGVIPRFLKGRPMPTTAPNGLPMALAHVPIQVVEKARNIKLLAMDVDGVLTPSSIIWDAQGIEQKVFNVKDGWALRKMKALGLHTAIITGRKSAIVEKRGHELDFSVIFQAVPKKSSVLDELLEIYNLCEEQVAYMGDDLPDLEVLERVGLAVCPKDASFEVLDVCDYVTSRNGGDAAVREWLDIIRYAQVPQ
jgi:3-deoxy-D-manno-octulosonate 8-phosphate phosphatase (KDO 8-P phosphatase)